MMISDLPRDLIEEILFRVPASTLGRSQFTCKRWNALVNNKIFITKHLAKAPWQSLVITKTGHCFFAVSSINKNVDSLINPRYLHLMDPRRNSKVNISEVFHCDGLLLCITSENKRFVVWNPCTGQTMWLKFIMPCKNYSEMYVFGYAQNNLCQNFKILRRFRKGSREVMEIYEFSSNSWTLLDDELPANCDIQSKWVSLKGNTYWIALSQSKRVLLCFDFSTQKFRCLSFPIQNCYCQLSLGKFREQQLSVLQWKPQPQEVEIWVSTKIETTSVWWSKFVNVRISGVHDFPLFSTVGGSLFINYDKKAAVRCQTYMKYNGNLVHLKNDGNLVQNIGEEEEDKFREICHGKSTDLISWGGTFHYVPSLHQIQEGINVTARGKRKRS